MTGAPQKEIGEDGLPIPPYAIYNIGNHQPENLLNFVEILQEKLIAASILPEDYDFSSAQKLVPMQAGDVVATYADISLLEKDFNFKPKTSLRNGLRNFAEWYRNFYQRVNRMKITVVGMGYVGLSLAVLLAQHHEVTALDIIDKKIQLINEKKSPIQDEYIEQYF